jgi:hypothetical protein
VVENEQAGEDTKRDERGFGKVIFFVLEKGRGVRRGTKATEEKA